MAGFPGETGNEFNETVEFIRSLPFGYLHLFPFSPRPGTRAWTLHAESPVPPGVVAERMATLRALAAEKTHAHRRSFIGAELDAITLHTPQAMRKHHSALPILLLFSSLVAISLSAQQTDAPHLEKRGVTTQLIVDGKPFLILGGELHNSSSSSLEYMGIWQYCRYGKSNKERSCCDDSCHAPHATTDPCPNSERFASPRISREHFCHMSQSFFESQIAEHPPTEQSTMNQPDESGTLALSANDFSALEERIVRAVKLVKSERQARTVAERRAEDLEGQLSDQSSIVKNLQEEVRALNTEREQVRQRVERLLAQLDALEV